MATDNPTLSNGRYQVLSCIGKGGMAAVFLAFDTVLKTKRAIKVLHPEYMTRESMRQRFATEAVAMAQLSHQNVVRVFDHGQEGLTSYIVMEYVPYGSLRNYLSTHGVLSVSQAVNVCLDIAQSLKQAHDEGIIHRDIKPDNILLSEKGAKLTDFGLARLNEHATLDTHTQAVMGTFAFMAPEQRLSAKRTTHQADIYSLSASLFAMLSTKDPSDLYDISSQLSLLAHIDAGVADIISKGCHMDCALRYQDVDAMIEDLMSMATTLPQPKDLALVVSGAPPPVDLSELKRTWLIYTSNHNTDVKASETLFIESDVSASQNSSETFLIESIDQLNLEDESLKETIIEGGDTKNYSMALGLLFSAVALIFFVAFLQETVETSKQGLKFELFEPKTPEDKVGFEKVTQALLSGEISQTERLLSPYLEKYPNEPAVHSVASVLYILQKKDIASAEASYHGAILSRDREEALAELIVLADRSWREERHFPVLLSQWSELRSASNSPMVELVYLMSTRFYQDPNLMMSEIAEAKLKYPSDIVFVLFEILYLQQNNRTADLLELLDKSIQSHPSVTNFRLERGVELYRQGRLEVAEDVMLQVLKQDANLVQARLFLAGIYVQRNDEIKQREQVIFSLSDTTSVSEEVFFLEHYGNQLANVGQLHEANKIWQLCVTHANAAGMSREATDCISQAIGVHLVLGQALGPEWDGLLRQLEEQILNPSMNDVLRQFWSVLLQYAKGMQAARSGDVDTAMTHLQIISSKETSSEFFNRNDFFVSSLKLELILSSDEEADPESYQHLLDTMLYVSYGDCLDVFRRAEVAEKLNQEAEVESLLNRILARECSGDLSNQGMVYAMTLILAANRSMAKGDTAKAQAHLDSFQRFWLEPDESLELVQAKNKLIERISQ